MKTEKTVTVEGVVTAMLDAMVEAISKEMNDEDDVQGILETEMRWYEALAECCAEKARRTRVLLGTNLIPPSQAKP